MDKKKPFFRLSCFLNVLSVFAITIFVYFIIYVAFKGNGIFTPGIGLEKSDWLSFLGSYLSFAGTTVISGVAIFQTYHYQKLNTSRDNQRRSREIQPIFSIKITNMDTLPLGSCEVFCLHPTSTPPKHRNFTLQIENVGLYPVKHVIIFQKYIAQLLKSNDVLTLQGAYEDSPDYSAKNIIKVLHSEYEQSNQGLPNWFNINYEDIDGVDMCQTFELKNFDGTNYYALSKISEI